jgi:CDP-diacylglycerol---serine O-phosphatidyltransferase
VKIKSNVPNFITCLNLFSGSLGIVAAMEDNLTLASAFVAMAALFDFLDGMAARILHVKSAIGKELDSLADVISFGLLPGVIMMQLMKASVNLPGQGSSFLNPFIYVAFIIPVFSAIRLAKFNLDPRQTDSFLGLPVPANAIFIASFPLIFLYSGHQSVKDLISNYYVLAVITLLFSSLLLSEIPLFSLKFKNLTWKDNQLRITFLLISLIALFLLNFTAIPLIILLYIAMSLTFRQ